MIHTRSFLSEDHALPVGSVDELGTLDFRLRAARARGIARITVVVPEAGWPLLESVAKALHPHRRSRRTLRLALESRALPGGQLRSPGGSFDIDEVHATVETIRVAEAEQGARRIRTLLADGRSCGLEVVRSLAERWVDVIRENPGVVVARPFELLRQAGIPEEWMPRPALQAMARLAGPRDVRFLIDEASRTPRPETIRVWARAGATLVPGSGARLPVSAGRYEYVARLAAQLLPHEVVAGRTTAPILRRAS